MARALARTVAPAVARLARCRARNWPRTGCAGLLARCRRRRLRKRAGRKAGGRLDAAGSVQAGLLVAAAVLAATAPLAAAVAQAPEEPGVFKGRKIAEVMSYRGAPWLERATRIEEEHPDELMAALPIETGMLVVDIGCGSGYYARRLAAAVGPEGSVLCNDIQPEMLRIAAEFAADAGVRNMSTVLGTKSDARLPEGEVDLMLLVDVYHEFSAPEAMLQSMREALAPDGVIALAEFRLEGRSARAHQARAPHVDRAGDEGVAARGLRTRRTDRLAADAAPVPVRRRQSLSPRRALNEPSSSQPTHHEFRTSAQRRAK